jgi:pyruvate kinase
MNRRIINPHILGGPGEGLRRTKIVATMGPAVDSVEAMTGMVRAGTDVFRLNLSHGDRDDHERLVDQARRASMEAGHPTAIMVDLQGPRLRVGRMKDGGQVLKAGTEAILTSRDMVGEDNIIPVSYEGLEEDLVEGVTILIDDARVECTVTSVKADGVHVAVVRGGNQHARFPDICAQRDG